MITIAHVSDLHLDRGPHAAERAGRVAGYLRAMPGPVDVVLVTGDIADHGKPDEYEEAARCLDLPYEVLVLPGNHDVRSAFAAGLLGRPAADAEINRFVTVGGARFALCDSTIPGQDDGMLSDGTLTWLDDTLTDAGDELPVFVCFHHPPVVLHAPHVDVLRQFGEERLAEVLHRHPQVVAVLCGHAHVAAATTFAGRPLVVGPGVVSTVRMPLEGGETVDRELPPAFAFHVLDDQRRLTTHFRALS